MWIIVISFILYAVPNYLTFDPATADIPYLRQDLPLHYVMLVGHVWFGTLTMLTMCIQIWPWVRQHHPAVHRWSGRVYVFAGVIPTGLLALAIVPFAAGPPGNAIGGLLWLAATIAGFRAARQRRFAAHRRWMIYSFALTLQIVWGRVLLLVLPLVPGYDAADPHTQDIVVEAISWLGFVINLLAAQFWLEWTARKEQRKAALLEVGAHHEESPARAAV
ncbi:MAG TPA: DUF2306 domain-containing protein [Actinophytocola sp.]|nr:DUF2306 domain-containing protein [Actinophytocola sp.]